MSFFELLPSTFWYPSDYVVQGRIQGGVFGVKTLFGNFFHFARVFKKKPKTLPKFSRLYKKNSNPLPRKISGYAPDVVPLGKSANKTFI